jgi:hypothetical protein
LKANINSGDRTVVTQAGLSKLAAPPLDDAVYLGATAVGLIGLGMLGGAIYLLATNSVGLGIGIPLIIVGIALIAFVVRAVAIQGPKEQAAWEKTFLCLDCGAKFIPPLSHA